MKRVSTSLTILVVFGCLYVFCLIAYMFITSFNSVENRGVDHMNARNVNKLDHRVKLDQRPKLDHTLQLAHRLDIFTRIRRFLKPQDIFKKDFTLNICCGKNEYLNSTYECTKTNNTLNFQDKHKTKFYRSAVVNENLKNSVINVDKVAWNYNFKPQCPKDEMMVITWSKDEPPNYYISQKNGHLLETSDFRLGVEANYSSSSFCLDIMKNQDNSIEHVAFLCLCNEKLCVQKCCPREFYFNTITNTCKKATYDEISPPYNPNFPGGTRYYLMHNVPNCTVPDKMIIGEKDPPIKDILGHMMALTKAGGDFNRKKYCLDLFSNGDNKSNYVNGFYCPKEVEITKSPPKKTTKHTPKQTTIQITKQTTTQTPKQSPMPSSPQVPQQPKPQEIKENNDSSSTHKKANFGIFIILFYFIISMKQVVL